MHKNQDGSRSKIRDVVNRTECRRHNALVGESCWDVICDSNKEELLSAVCGPRIRAAGFVGKISETSVQSKRKLDALRKKEVAA